MTRLVFVDLDGTLLAGGSEARFIAHLTATRRIGVGALLRSLVFALRHWPRYGRHVWKKNKAYLAGLSTAEVARWGEAFAAERLTPLLRSAVRERITCHRAAGDRVILMTGTPDFLARPLAEVVGTDGWIATACAQCDGRYSDSPPLTHPFAAAKLRHAREAAELVGISLAECVAYADTGDDVELLAAVGTAIAVAPDRRLARHARASGWEIMAAAPARPLRRMLASAGQRA